MKPRVAVITLNWNGIEDSLRCLDGLRIQTYPRYDVFVVDNGSENAEADFLEDQHGHWIHLERSKVNLGFAGGNNLVLRKILNTGEYDFIATLNNDTTVQESWLSHLVENADVHGRIGMLASKMVFMDRPKVINSTGIRILRDGTAIDRGRNQFDSGQYDQRLDIFGPSAGAALYSSTLLQDAGLFDEDFFAYFEDVDLAWRARLQGWRGRYVPDSVVRHRYSASSGQFSPFKIYQGERNRLWVLLKNYPPEYLLLGTPYNFTKKVLMLSANLRGKGRGSMYSKRLGLLEITRNMQRAQLDAIRGAPRMLSKRREAMISRSVAWSTVRKWFTDYGVPLMRAPYV